MTRDDQPFSVSRRVPWRRAGKTSCVCVTMAASLPSPGVMRVCQTMVVRPRCKRRAFGPGGVADRNGGKEIGLALDGRGLHALGQVDGRGGAAEIVGKRHDGAAVQDTEAVAELLAYHQLFPRRARATNASPASRASWQKAAVRRDACRPREGEGTSEGRWRREGAAGAIARCPRENRRSLSTNAISPTGGVAAGASPCRRGAGITSGGRRRLPARKPVSSCVRAWRGLRRRED